MRLPGKAVVWLIYFDRSLSRRMGRKVSRKYAVENPTLDELVKACKRLNIDFQVKSDAKHPRLWWGEKGYVIMDKFAPKSRLLNIIALEIKKLRGDKIRFM